MASNPVIDVDHLTFRYGEHAALHDVSLRVERGEFLGVIGPNGGGKTTLLRILLGLERNYQGVVKLFGEDPARTHAWRARVGVVPQHRDLAPRFPIRARDVVELGTYMLGAPRLSKAERRDRVEAALALVGAEEWGTPAARTVRRSASAHFCGSRARAQAGIAAAR